MVLMNLVGGYLVVGNRSRGLMGLCFGRRLSNNKSWLWDLLDMLRRA